MPTASLLQIAVVGASNIGSTFAFQLARAGGHDVTAVARPGSPRLEQLRRDGGVVDVKGERAAMRVADALNERVPYDLVIVTLLAHQVDAVLPSLQRSAAKAIQFMFVTFEPERLRDAVGAERCSFGMPYVQAKLDGNGRLRATVGAAGQKTIMDRRAWVDLFAAAGLPAKLEPDMPLWLRCHVPLCVAFESVSVAGMRRGGGASLGQATTVARGVRESYALIRELGYAVYPRGKARLAGCPTPLIASLLWTLSRVKPFRELLATGEAECCALVDTMVNATAAAGARVDVPRIIALRPR